MSGFCCPDTSYFYNNLFKDGSIKRSSSEHLENLEGRPAMSLPHYPLIINSRKCEVCHAKKRGAHLIFMRCHPVSNVPSGAGVTKCSSVQSYGFPQTLTGDSSLISGAVGVREGWAWCARPFVHQGEGLQSGRLFFSKARA